MSDVVAVVIVVILDQTLFCFADFEASFIRLMDKLTNGSRIEINETGPF